MNFLRFPIGNKLIKQDHEIKTLQTGETVVITCSSREYEPNAI